MGRAMSGPERAAVQLTILSVLHYGFAVLLGCVSLMRFLAISAACGLGWFIESAHHQGNASPHASSEFFETVYELGGGLAGVAALTLALLTLVSARGLSRRRFR